MKTVVDSSGQTFRWRGAGRFAPSPTGRMHMGNICAALASYLSAKSRGLEWVLRIEDLDPQRSKRDYALQLEDDLRWLGLYWDRGGYDYEDSCGPYRQSLRGDYYAAALERLAHTGLLYPCTCTRADIMATQAPHQSDGRVIYSGHCRPEMPNTQWPFAPERHSIRIAVGHEPVEVCDRRYGRRCYDLAAEAGDFILKRSDGAWAYQLAVVVDDAAMGISEVVRGEDLLLSAATQNYLYGLLGLPVPEYEHIPLVTNADGIRLSKRDASMSMEYLRAHFTPEQILAQAAELLGLKSFNI